MATRDSSTDAKPAEDLDALNRRIAEEAAAATTADKLNPPADK